MLKCGLKQWPLDKNKYLNTALNCGPSRGKISSGFMLPNAEMTSWTVGISIGFTLNYIKTPSPTVVSRQKIIQWFQASKFWHNIFNSGVSLKKSSGFMLPNVESIFNSGLSFKQIFSDFMLTNVKTPSWTVKLQIVPPKTFQWFHTHLCSNAISNSGLLLQISSGFPLPIFDTTSWTVVSH